jgi:hypothetical protein
VKQHPPAYARVPSAAAAGPYGQAGCVDLDIRRAQQSNPVVSIEVFPLGREPAAKRQAIAILPGNVPPARRRDARLSAAQQAEIEP